MVLFRKFFVKIKILFSIRIRIMILLWISIPDLRSIHRRYPPNYLSNTMVPTARIHVRIVRQPDRHSDTQIDKQVHRRKFLLLVLSSQTYKTWSFVYKWKYCKVLTSEFWNCHILNLLSWTSTHTELVKLRNAW